MSSASDDERPGRAPVVLWWRRAATSARVDARWRFPPVRSKTQLGAASAALFVLPRPREQRPSAAQAFTSVRHCAELKIPQRGGAGVLRDYSAAPELGPG